MRSIEELRDLFTAYLQQEMIHKDPAGLYEPGNYFLQIGGKRLRPVLLLLATELFDGKAEEALPAALAIEYFHNFSLIHDDVMDAAPLRRGYTTLHEKYNLNTAILSGDALFIKSFEYLGKVTPEKFKRLFDIFIQTAIAVCEGQQYDIDFETKEFVTHAEYIEMIRLKTSVLLAASMQIGSLLGNAGEEESKLVYAYAENLGIAFQVQDDILDCYGDEKLVGKQPGGDILQNKKTLLMIEALKRSAENKDGNLQNWLSRQSFDHDEKRHAILNIFNQYGIREFGMQQRDLFIDRSMQALHELQLADFKKAPLKDLVSYLVLRDF